MSNQPKYTPKPDDIPPDVKTVNLKQINEGLGEFSITSEGLERMGFVPIGTKQNGKSAKYYAADTLSKIKSRAVAQWGAA